MLKNNLTPTSKPVKISIKLFRKYNPTSRTFGDFDNQAKSVCDALNGICYLDDSQIIEAHVFKFQDKSNSRVEISISDEV